MIYISYIISTMFIFHNFYFCSQWIIFSFLPSVLGTDPISLDVLADHFYLELGNIPYRFLRLVSHHWIAMTGCDPLTLVDDDDDFCSRMKGLIYSLLFIITCWSKQYGFNLVHHPERKQKKFLPPPGFEPRTVHSKWFWTNGLDHSTTVLALNICIHVNESTLKS